MGVVQQRRHRAHGVGEALGTTLGGRKGTSGGSNDVVTVANVEIGSKRASGGGCHGSEQEQQKHGGG